MKVLVNEIEKKVLVDIMHHFVTDSEIVILGDAAIEYKTLDCKQPYCDFEKFTFK